MRYLSSSTKGFAVLTRFGLLSTLLLFTVSCGNCLGIGGDKSPLSTQRSVEGQRYLLSAEDFKLEDIISLVRDNKVKDATELEKRINDGSGLSNVDIDQDTKIDYIMVKETRSDKGVVLNFVAVPSSTQDENRGETVASLTFSQNTSSKDVQVQGNYPAHVQGGENHHYSSIMPGGFSLGQAFFLAWLFSPGRSMFYQPFRPAYYVPRPVAYNRGFQSRGGFNSPTRGFGFKSQKSPGRSFFRGGMRGFGRRR